MRETDDSDLRLDLERALARLTPKQRAALWLWCQGYTQEAIATALGAKRTAITMRIMRACEAMRAKM